ncbi:AEC family transporter [Streptococcus suis]|uniref:AEC family transporter n=1 Tax=Streptococcus suis TaxID=1307 RepID=UPI001C9398A5|nr:transporter [Streptococcus suis]MBY5010020.1 transporter [Streptococcus suis]MDG4518241.1 transporter [Streptococcus suis]
MKELELLTRAFSFICVIGLGYILKIQGIVRREDATIFSTLVMNVTLPASLFIASSTAQVSFSLYLPFLLGIFCNLLLNLVGYWEAKHSGHQASVGLMQLSGYNIGTFTLPFVQAFFPASSLLSVIVFDAGNAIMVLGGNYSIATGIDVEKEGMSVTSFFKNISRSIPLMVYLVSLLLASLSIQLPQEILSTLTIASNANPFLAMLMLGILLDLKLNWKEIGRLSYLLFLRVGANILMGALIYFLLPIEQSMKMMLLVCLASPISVMSPIYALKLGSRSAEPANVNSLSILVSLAVMVLLIFLFV